jgi:hypothetical protein
MRFCAAGGGGALLFWQPVETAASRRTVRRTVGSRIKSA